MHYHCVHFLLNSNIFSKSFFLCDEFLCMGLMILSVYVTANVDASIMQSLENLNIEFPELHSPVKKGDPIASESVPPVFDRTPLLCRSETGAVNVDSGERTAGPLFDSTPFQHESSPVLDSTPVLQDTPSLTVDGTEEVTQEHNVLEQLAKYAQHQLEKEAKHQEKLKLYYRKYPLRSRSSKVSDEACPNAPAEEVSVMASAPKKPRVAISKKKQVVMESPRRSPRLFSGLIAPDQSPSPSRMRHAKRKRDADKTYVPESSDVVALDDDASDFQAPIIEVLFSYSVCFCK